MCGKEFRKANRKTRRCPTRYCAYCRILSPFFWWLNHSLWRPLRFLQFVVCCLCCVQDEKRDYSSSNAIYMKNLWNLKSDSLDLSCCSLPDYFIALENLICFPCIFPFLSNIPFTHSIPRTQIKQLIEQLPQLATVSDHKIYQDYDLDFSSRFCWNCVLMFEIYLVATFSRVWFRPVIYWRITIEPRKQRLSLSWRRVFSIWDEHFEGISSTERPNPNTRNKLIWDIVPILNSHAHNYSFFLSFYNCFIAFLLSFFFFDKSHYGGSFQVLEEFIRELPFLLRAGQVSKDKPSSNWKLHYYFPPFWFSLLFGWFKNAHFLFVTRQGDQLQNCLLWMCLLYKLNPNAEGLFFFCLYWLTDMFGVFRRILRLFCLLRLL